MPNILDRLSPATRHAVFSVAAAGLAWLLPWVAANYTSWGLPPQVLAVVGVFLPIAVAAGTKLTAQYGVGANNGPAAVAGVEALPDVPAV